MKRLISMTLVFLLLLMSSMANVSAQTTGGAKSPELETLDSFLSLLVRGDVHSAYTLLQDDRGTSESEYTEIYNREPIERYQILTEQTVKTEQYTKFMVDVLYKSGKETWEPVKVIQTSGGCKVFISPYDNPIENSYQVITEKPVGTSKSANVITPQSTFTPKDSFSFTNVQGVYYDGNTFNISDSTIYIYGTQRNYYADYGSTTPAVAEYAIVYKGTFSDNKYATGTVEGNTDFTLVLTGPVNFNGAQLRVTNRTPGGGCNGWGNIYQWSD